MEGDGQKSKDKRQKSDQDKKEIIYRRMVGKIVHPVADEIIRNGNDEDRGNDDQYHYFPVKQEDDMRY